jgi:hypothetical protein
MKEVICRIFVLALLTPAAFAGEFKTAGAYDGDAALVDIDSVKPFKAKETVTVFQWGLAHSAAVLQIDGIDYDSIVETAIVDCSRLNTRHVAQRVWQYRDLLGRTKGGGSANPVKTQAPPDGEAAEPVQTIEKSPAGLAVRYACAVAQSKTLNKPISYKDPSSLVTPSELICEPPDYIENRAVIHVAFSEAQGLIQAGTKVASDSAITRDTLRFSLRLYFDGPVNRKIQIDRSTGKLWAEKTERYPAFSMDCRPREKNKF